MTDLCVSTTPEAASGGAPRRLRAFLNRLVARRTLHVFILFLLLLQVIAAGVFVRAWLFSHTGPIRFKYDIANAWNHGSDALNWRHSFFGGIVHLYDPRINYFIDYPPIRIYIVTAWVDLVRHWYGAKVVLTDNVMWPMLVVNGAFEFFAAVGMYLFCRKFLGCFRSTIAALVVWFSPALLVNTFIWPQWDVWVLAPVLFAAWAVVRERWFIAGLCIGLGAMLKGQTLFILPWLLMFMLVQPRPLSQADTPEYLAIPLRRRAWRLGQIVMRWITRVLLRLVLFVMGGAVVVLLVTLPFTLRHNAYWLSVFKMQIKMVQPMSVGFWNVPGKLASEYGWQASNAIWPLPVPWWRLSLTIAQWLHLAVLIWTAVIALLAMRALKARSPRFLLVPGLVFAVVVSLTPGMHERYGIWAAGLLAPAVVISPMAAFTYLLMVFIATADPLASCLGNNGPVAPHLQQILNSSWTDCASVWLFATMLMSYQLYLYCRNTCPEITNERPPAIVVAAADK